MIWHSTDRTAVLKELGVDDKKGLPNGVADMRLEKYGKNYTVDDVAKLWLDVLPYACTAEDEALQRV